VVAGVIGKRKFTYDLYGDTVNTAARMEAQGLPDEIQVSEEVFEALRDEYVLELRGPVEIKGKGVMNTYLLEGKRSSRLGPSLTAFF
jgi:adenylate cyclase